MTGIGAAHGRVALSPLSQSDDDGIGIVISAARRSRTKSRAALVLESSDEEDPYELQNTAPPGTLITGQTPGAKAREGIVPWVTPGGSARAKNREPFGLLSNLHGSKAAPTPRPSVTPAAFRKRRDGMAREFFKE